MQVIVATDRFIVERIEMADDTMVRWNVEPYRDYIEFADHDAGKVYYFAANISMTGGEMVSPTMGPNGTMTGGAMVRGAPLDIFFNLAQLTEDEGKYRVKAWKLSSSKPGK